MKKKLTISGAVIITDPITSSKTTDSQGRFIIEGIQRGWGNLLGMRN